MSGDVVATRLAVTGAFAAARKLTERSTQEKLLKYACQHPEAPRLNRCQKRRLMKAVRQQSALDAMLDQNEAGASVLSVIIARDVFRSPESAESLTLAWVLIAEISKCVTAQEWKSLTAYQLRRIEQEVGGVGTRSPNSATKFVAPGRTFGILVRSCWAIFVAHSAVRRPAIGWIRRC